MEAKKNINYGVLESTDVKSNVDLAVEEITRLGFTIINSGYKESDVVTISNVFDEVYNDYITQHGLEYLQLHDEQYTIRLPLALDKIFLDLARNEHLLDVISCMIAGKFILNQQNGIINPVLKKYNQDAWHRDLPYQHFVCSRPIAVNALYCIDDFTLENGATGILPATHLQETFPSDYFIAEHAKQITAPAGSFIILDCMTYHRGEKNCSSNVRRAVNHLFTIPYIKQQISIPSIINDGELDSSTKELLGYDFQPFSSIKDYIDGRC